MLNQKVSESVYMYAYFQLHLRDSPHLFSKNLTTLVYSAMGQTLTLKLSTSAPSQVQGPLCTKNKVVWKLQKTNKTCVLL